MRAAAILLALIAGSATRRAAASSTPPIETVEDDDPKCARGECLPPRAEPLDEDDPKLARGLRLRRPTTRLELSYRFLEVADPYGGGLPFHLVQLSGYPVSNIFRLGLGITAGGAARYSAWLVDVGVTVGVQYPYRVTPFLDVGFNAGVIGAEIVGRKVVSYEYGPSVEAGLSVFIAGRFHLTAAVGWAHPIYGGVDARAIEAAIAAGAKPRYDVQAFGYDTVTARVGLGL